VISIDRIKSTMKVLRDFANCALMTIVKNDPSILYSVRSNILDLSRRVEFIGTKGQRPCQTQLTLVIGWGIIGNPDCGSHKGPRYQFSL
jgi:hypothetical protein